MCLGSVDFRALSTVEIREALVACLARFPESGPGELSSWASLADCELDVREPDADWAKTSFAVGECYRNLLPYASALRLSSGLMATEVVRSRAKEMFRAARDVFLSCGCAADAALCLEAMAICDEYDGPRTQAEATGIMGPACRRHAVS